MTLPTKTWLRDVITIPERVADSDFVMRLSDGVAHAEQTLAEYVVTDSLKRNFAEALGLIAQALEKQASQAAFLHGSFGSGKSHFMAVLHEILHRNKFAREKQGLAEQIADADRWLQGRRVLTLTYHLLGARSIEEAVLGGYRAQIARLHLDAAPPAVHNSDGLLRDAANLRQRIGEEAFFDLLSGRAGQGSPGWGSYRGAGWDAGGYAAAAAAAPGTAERDRLVSDLTASLFSGAVHSGEYLDLDTGLAVLSQHAKELGYDVVVLFLDELILWLSQHLSNMEFVSNEGGKLAKFVEAADAHRPVPLVSFVARQRDLTAFLGPHVPGAERQAFADVLRYANDRFTTISLEERNLPLIAERRLLQPKDGTARKVLDDAFAAVSRRADVWDTLRLGAQFDDAGIGSDDTVFRRLYPFTPALVATLVALSQALQRERTALKTMLRLLVEHRDTLVVNDLLGVAELYDELIGRGDLPDEPKLRQHFETARTIYRTRLRPALLAINKLDEAGAAAAPPDHQFRIDDKIVKTLLLAALVPDVPALSNLTAAKLHALNYGSIDSPLPGMEPQLVLDRLRLLSAEAPGIHIGEGTDPVVSVELSEVDVTVILERVPATEDTRGARQRLLRELICAELGVRLVEGIYHEQPYPRDWRGRRHQIDVVFGNVRDRDQLPDTTLIAPGETWRVVVDYPFDAPGWGRASDLARIESLHDRRVTARSVFWLPFYLTEERLTWVSTLLRLNYVLAGGGDDRIYALAPDWAPADRQQAKLMLAQMQQNVRSRLLEVLKQAYGAAKPQPGDVEPDPAPVFDSLADGLRLDNPVGGTLAAAFGHLTAQLLAWSYPGTPNLPVDEPPVRPAELSKVYGYARRAAGDPTRSVVVEPADRASVKRICNPLRLGELAENKYVLNLTTSWWSQHFLQQAKAQGYAGRYPVRMLRELTDAPQPRGLDRRLQNLIIAVFALDQDLAWYRYEVAEPAPALDGVSDDLELRQPRPPSDDAWRRAVPHAGKLFGLAVSPLRSAANVADLARQVRDVSRRLRGDAKELVRLLEQHAGQLGLDERADEGRLATARRLARLLEQLVGETDDVVLVELLGGAELGSVDDITASKSLTEARRVVDALTRTQWSVIAAAASLTGERAEEARAIREQLADAARREQLHADLVDAMDEATTQASALLARSTPVAVVPPPSTGTDQATTTVGKRPRVHPLAASGHQRVGSRDAVEAVAQGISALLAEQPGRQVDITWEVVYE